MDMEQDPAVSYLMFNVSRIKYDKNKIIIKQRLHIYVLVSVTD